MSELIIARTVQEAPQVTAVAPHPLRRQPEPAERYPVEVLPNMLCNAAKAIADKVQAPMAICAQSVLAAATLAVQGHADVLLPMGQTRPLSLFFLTLAQSGERKSSCDYEALGPVVEKEKQLNAKYSQDQKLYRNKKDAWDKGRSDILRATKKTAQWEIEAALNALGDSPESPLSPLLTCPEPTYEGICRHLINGLPNIGVFSDEGGQFIGGHGMNEENKLKTAAAFCNLWDGKPIKRMRAGDGTIILPGRRISVHLMAQPAIASQLLSNQLLEAQGLLSRFLISAPDSSIGTRLQKEPLASSNSCLAAYQEQLLKILNAPLPLAEGKNNEIEPRILGFSEKARQEWQAYADEVERNMAYGGIWQDIRGFANKLPEHAARIAGVLALIDNLLTDQITSDHIERGILLAQYYATEALRLHKQGYTSPDIELAEKLLNWIHTNWKQTIVSLPDIYQRGLHQISDAKTARKTVGILEEHGWLVRLEKGATINGQRRKDAWAIIQQQPKIVGNS